MEQVLVVGKGWHAGRNIYPSLRELGVSVEAVAARHAEEAAAFSRGWNPAGRGYGSVREMLAAEPARHVLVVTQAADAPALVRECLAAQRTVFVEKPLGLSAAEAEDVAEAAQAAGGIVQVGFIKRFAPAYVRAKKCICGEEFGPVRSFRYSFDVNAGGFCRDDHDFFYFVAIHGLDLVRWLFGEPQELRAVRCAQGAGASYALVLRMASGAVGTCAFENRAAHTKEQERLEVTFEAGFLCADNLERVALRRPGSGDWQTLSESEQVLTPTLSPASGPARDLYLRGFVPELQHFLSPQARDGSADNARTCALCDSILRAL